MGKLKLIGTIIVPTVSILLYYSCKQGDIRIKQSIEINVDAETIANFWGDLGNVQKIHPILQKQETLSESKSYKVVDGENVAVVTNELRVEEEVFEGFGAPEFFITRRKYMTQKGIYHEYSIENPLGMMETVFFMKKIKDNKTLVEETSLITMPRILLPFIKRHVAKNHIQLMEKIKDALEGNLT